MSPPNSIVEAATPGPSPPTAPRPPIGTATKLYYGLGSIAFGIKDGGFRYLLLIYYNQVLGLPEQWVGLALMVALVLDALCDPIVGYVSDNFRSRWGRRHPFMYMAALPVAISYALLFMPPQGLRGEWLLVYFFIMTVFVRTLITVYEIPSASLVAELSDDYDQRTSILSFRYFFGWWGGLLMGAIAFGVLLTPDASNPVGVLNASGYRHYGVIAGVVMLAAILISSIGTHDQIPYLRKPPEGTRLSLRRSVAELRETLSNRPFLMLFAASMFGAMAQGLNGALSVYLYTYFWGLSSEQISIVILALFPAAAVALLLAPYLSRRMGKKSAALLVFTLALVVTPIPIGLRLIDQMPENGSALLLAMLLLFNLIEGSLFITTMILVASMVTDVVEDSEVTTGRRSEGVFFAARSILEKATTGIGLFTASLVLGIVSFPQGADPGEVAPSILRNLGLVYIPSLAMLYACSIVCLSRYHIDRDRHAENLRRLADKAEP